MNLEIANRLVEYRKRAGYSQEELADKLGISRQAVSKWERVEASPDTDNLIALANLYGVSLDELINGKKDPEPKAKVEEEKEETVEPEQTVEEGVHISNHGIHVGGKDKSYVHIDEEGIHTCNKNGEKRHYGEKELERRLRQKTHPAVAIAYSLSAILALILFFIFGFAMHHVLAFDVDLGKFVVKEMPGFAWSWIFFVAIPIIPSFIQAIVYRRFKIFNWPVFVTVLFLVLGMTSGLWHPMWILFLTIPLYYAIFAPIDDYHTSKKAKEMGVRPEELDKDYKDTFGCGPDEDDD